MQRTLTFAAALLLAASLVPTASAGHQADCGDETFHTPSGAELVVDVYTPSPSGCAGADLHSSDMVCTDKGDVILGPVNAHAADSRGCHTGVVVECQPPTECPRVG